MKSCLLLMIMLLGLWSCSHYEPYESHPISEIPEGPGLFSGDDGEFVIYRKEKQD